MRRKKDQLHALVLPETHKRLKEMVREADKRYLGTRHSLGGIIDLLVLDAQSPIDRQREKVRELARNFQMEKDLLDQMEETTQNKEMQEKSKELFEEVPA